MILVLIAAALILGVIGDLVDTLVILLPVLLNAAIRLVQAWRRLGAGGRCSDWQRTRPRCCAEASYIRCRRKRWCRATCG